MAQKAETCGVEPMKLRGGVMCILCAMFLGSTFTATNKVEAGELVLTLGSWHSGPDQKTLWAKDIAQYNKQYPGRDVIGKAAPPWQELNLGIIYNWSNGNYLGVIPKNSVGELSVMLGKSWKVASALRLSLGVATGYPAAPLLPALGVHYTVRNIRISAMPYFAKTSSRAVWQDDTKTALWEERLGSNRALYGIVLVGSIVFPHN